MEPLLVVHVVLWMRVHVPLVWIVVGVLEVLEVVLVSIESVPAKNLAQIATK